MAHRKKALYRMQDNEGRGPWRPGLSTKWSDPYREIPKTHIHEFGLSFLARVPKYYRMGTACASISQLKRWFTIIEIERLYMLGFSLVVIRPDAILEESENQSVFVVRGSIMGASRVIANTYESAREIFARE